MESPRQRTWPGISAITIAVNIIASVRNSVPDILGHLFVSILREMDTLLPLGVRFGQSVKVNHFDSSQHHHFQGGAVVGPDSLIGVPGSLLACGGGAEVNLVGVVEDHIKVLLVILERDLLPDIVQPELKTATS
jgi:hypothetical protein